jgi:ParB/RepB/Spo0J family partition protein
MKKAVALKKKTTNSQKTPTEVLKANEHYEAAQAASDGENYPSIAQVEKQFKLKKDQLKNYRINKARLERKKEEAPTAVEPATRNLDRDLESVVREISKTNGSPRVGWKRIAEVLGLPEELETQEWSLKIFDAMIDREMVSKGVLMRDSEAVQDILRAEFFSAPVPAKLMSVPLAKVVVCHLNPRKVVDEASIEEMADSILEHGIIQPPIARPGKYADTWEVVYGQRRLLGQRRANEKSTAAGNPAVETIQLLVREIDDRTVLEEGWVENLQRVDVGIREEVTGFQALLDLKDDKGEPIYSITSLARRLGKDKQFVSRRMKLINVPEEMWKALDDGLIGVRQMELVGRLPDEASRKKAAGMVLRPKYRTEDQPLTVRETVEMLRTDFLVSLRGCPWSLKDAELVPVKFDKKGERVSGGACDDCQWRTGGDPDLQESLSGSGTKQGSYGSAGGKQGVDANSCMLPSCFKAKQEATWVLTMKEASESGAKVLTQEESSKVFSQWAGNTPMPQSGMVSLTESPGYYETGHHAGEDTLPKWEKMIKYVAPADLIIARNEATGAICRLLKREVAIELAEEALGKQGKESPFANRPGAKKSEAGGGESQNSGPSEWEIKRQREEKLGAAVKAKLADAIKLQKAPSEEVIIELLLGWLWEELNYEGGLMAEFLAMGLPKFDDEQGDDDGKARDYLETVIRPEIARAPYAWAARALYEIYDQMIRLDEPLQSDGLFKVLALDREKIVATEEPQEEPTAEVEA